VADVRLNYPGLAPNNQFRHPPRLTNESLGYDIFSHELGLFSQRLTSLAVDDATLNFADFFTCGAESDWPHLQNLDLSQTQPGSTDATWYFSMNPNERMDEYPRNAIRSLRNYRNLLGDDIEMPATIDRTLEHFRTTIILSKFQEIYLAAASAAKRMPKLVTMTIHFNLQGSFRGDGNHELICEVGHLPRSWTLSKSSLADIRAEWTVTPSIPIADEILSAWREFGSARGAKIELYRIENPDDDTDCQLIEDS
jgi:hypothetical protein